MRKITVIILALALITALGSESVDGRRRTNRARRKPPPAVVATPAPAPVATPTPGVVVAPDPSIAPSVGSSVLRPPGSPILADGVAASFVRRSSFEPRPENAAANATVPTAAQRAHFYSYTGQWGECESLRGKVTGNFTGTTDEIMQWAAWKWGLPEDLVRAVATTESYWRMSQLGDAGLSFGLFQIKNVDIWHGGTYPLSKDASAFNADYWAGIVRHYYEGCATWMVDYTHNGSQYGAGDLWGSIGAWFSGDWHSDAARRYVEDVRHHLAARTWAQKGF